MMAAFTGRKEHQLRGRGFFYLGKETRRWKELEGQGERQESKGAHAEGELVIITGHISRLFRDQRRLEVKGREINYCKMRAALGWERKAAPSFFSQKLKAKNSGRLQPAACSSCLPFARTTVVRSPEAQILTIILRTYSYSFSIRII